MAADDESSSDEGFTFRDRRSRSSTLSDEAPASSAASPAPAFSASAAPSPTSAAGPASALLENDAADAAMGMMMGDDEEGDTGELPDVNAVLALFLGELRNLAWLRMGLVANPGTGKIERDLDQAKVAIDTVAFLAQQLELSVAPQERLPLKALVSDLQLNFVEQSKRT